MIASFASARVPAASPEVPPALVASIDGPPSQLLLLSGHRVLAAVVVSKEAERVLNVAEKEAVDDVPAAPSLPCLEKRQSCDLHQIVLIASFASARAAAALS